MSKTLYLHLIRSLPIATLAAVLGFGAAHLSPTLEAQKGASKVGFVNVQKVLESHPRGAVVAGMRKTLETRLTDIQKQAAPIQQKGANATAKERQTLAALQQSGQALVQKYQADSKAQLGPIEKELNTLIGTTARAQGFGIVLDRGAASTSGLVIYADEKNTDITTSVIKSIKK